MHPNQTSPTDDDLLTEREAAKLRRQSVRTLQAERLRGEGCCTYVKLGRSVRYRRCDVQEFIKANLRNGASPAGDGQ